MKDGEEHRVPVSNAAVAVLEAVEPLRRPSGLVFPSPPRLGKPLTDMTLTKPLPSPGLADRTTVHGLRSTFWTWAGADDLPARCRRGGARAPRRRRAVVCAKRSVREAPRVGGSVGEMPFARWSEVFLDPTAAAAVIDRVVHHATVLQTTSGSFRLAAAKQNQPPAAGKKGARR